MEIQVTPDERILIEDFMEQPYYFSKDWNGLMPVVKKIENELAKPDCPGVGGWYFWKDTFDGQVFTDMKKTYQLAIEFIEFYNKQIYERTKER